MPDRPVTPEQTIQRLRDRLWSGGLPSDRLGGILTLDEERALLDVAEAAHDLLFWAGHGPRENEAESRLTAALARLAKETTGD